MKLIVGLGNPGEKYCDTRHNIGAEAVAEAARRWGISLSHSSHQACWGKYRGSSGPLVLALPLNYMNLSGRSLISLANYFKPALSEILVVLDDLHLALGKLRFRPQGSAGGHNGLKSILEVLGTQEVPRLRLGIGEPGPEEDQADFVLSRFTEGERPLVAAAVEKAALGIQCWSEQGLERAMAAFN